MLNLTPQEILDQVNNTEPNDFYLDQIEKCIKHGDFFESWDNPLLNRQIGSFLFRRTGSGRKDLYTKYEIYEIYENEYFDDDGNDYCGCHIQVKKELNLDSNSYTKNIKQAIILDDKIPNSEYSIEEKDLIQFARWQTWLDTNIPEIRSESLK